MLKIIKSTDKAFFGYYPAVPAVCAQGYTREEVRKKLSSFMSLYLNWLVNK